MPLAAEEVLSLASELEDLISEVRAAKDPAADELAVDELVEKHTAG